jgi:hypothetical protein
MHAHRRQLTYAIEECMNCLLPVTSGKPEITFSLLFVLFMLNLT